MLPLYLIIPITIMQHKKLPKSDTKMNLPFKMIALAITILNFNWIETYSPFSYMTIYKWLDLTNALA